MLIGPRTYGELPGVNYYDKHEERIELHRVCISDHQLNTRILEPLVKSAERAPEELATSWIKRTRTTRTSRMIEKGCI